ncbi:MAG: hypothetical protein EBZ69_02540 [Alphaproteobacteria bacterium]|nr:hypothetical protein [Alphaproteobacteria bacterium]NDG19496.1 hypothetical protein [Betaproteobacteria bacterium]
MQPKQTGEMTMTKASKMSNAIARKYFQHDHDEHNETQQKCCFFSNGHEEEGWGFWVRPDGTVDIDDVSSNGELPSQRIVDACVVAGKKYLNRKPAYEY